MTFKDAVRTVLNIEGGEINDKYDHGGETKYGISKAAYPDLDIENLTIDDAESIYKRDYWDKLALDNLPPFLHLPMFDSAVNCGVIESVKFLQQSLRVNDDGILGPQTIASTLASPLSDESLVALYLLNRYKFYQTRDTFPRFGNGWINRCFLIAAKSFG